MAEKAESRGKIKEGIQRRELGLKDRGQHMEGVKDDGQTVARTSHEVRLSTTNEGAQEVKDAIKKAAQETRKEFEKQNQDLQKKTEECHKAEKDLLRRTDDAKKDAQVAKVAAGRIKETTGARSQELAAEHAAEKDGQFTSEQRQRQELDRKKSEERRNKQKHDLDSATVEF